jgi:arginyl-tRNA synthetase
MTSLKETMTQTVSGAFAALGYGASFGQVVESARPDLSQFQCNGALGAAKQSKAKPRDVAQRVVEALILAPGANAVFRTLDIAGPGFINIDLTDAYLTDHISGLASDARLGCEPVLKPLKIVVDYGGANIAKPMHVGHLRSSIIGECLKRIGRFLGHEVVGDVHLGDWGLQMGMLIAEMADRYPELPYFDAAKTADYPAESPVSIVDLQQLYPEASQRAKSNADAMEAARRATMELQAGRAGYRALWAHFVKVSVSELKSDFAALGVSFDLWLGESDVNELIPVLVESLRASGFAVASEGALIIDVSESADSRELPPLLLTKSDGAVLYATTDLATIEDRVRDGSNLVLYVVDNRQADHFVQVFRAARKTHVAPLTVGLEHIGFGTMNGSDGKPFKTREGGVMRLRDLMNTVTAKARDRMTEAEVAIGYSEEERASIARDVGLGALKYADLMNHRTKDYVFDLERFSSFEGKTGPYLLYATVRIKSILRKAEVRNLSPGQLIAPASDAERKLVLALAKFPDVISATFESRAPNTLAEYTYNLATTFNRFYSEHHILRETDSAQQQSWLTLVSCTARALEQALQLLGMQVPDRM